MVKIIRPNDLPLETEIQPEDVIVLDGATVRKFEAKKLALQDGSGRTDNAIARWDGTAGALQDSGISIDDTGNLDAQGHSILNIKDAEFNGSSSGSTVVKASATASGTLTLPAATDTLVGKATTDTLTNKTLTAPVISGGAIDNTPVGATTPSTGVFTTVSANSGAVTANSPALSVTQTWNNAGVNFVGKDTNITSTASGAGSAIERWRVNGTQVAYLDPSGNLVSSTGTIYTSETGAFRWLGSRSLITSPSDGVITLLNNAQSGFTSLNFGGNTSAFPALGRSGTTLVAYLADLSGTASFVASQIRAASGYYNLGPTLGGTGYGIRDNSGVVEAKDSGGSWAAIQRASASLNDIAGITFAQGDIIYFNGTNLVKLAAGTNGQLLKTQGPGANPVWTTASGTGDLLAANNLSDVANAATARSNLQALGSAATGQSFTGGVILSEYDNGTKSSSSYTPEPGNGPFQKVTNNGAHTLTASLNMGSFKLRVTNGASAGAITFSGFDKQLSGDVYATTSGNQYDIYINIAGKKTYQIKALQ